jgi:vacuolar-type H+-ATPase subunit E/Vma4
MSLDRLVQTLEQEADGRVAATLAQARADAERLLAGRSEEIARRRTTVLETREAELRAGSERALEQARREATRGFLEARAETLSRIRARVEALLADGVAGPTVMPALSRDLEQALDYLGGAAAVVEAPQPLAAALERALAGRGRIVTQPATAGRVGLVVRSADGSLTVDATPAARLARAWPRLAIELAARLEAVT